MLTVHPVPQPPNLSISVFPLGNYPHRRIQLWLFGLWVVALLQHTTLVAFHSENINNSSSHNPQHDSYCGCPHLWNDTLCVNCDVYGTRQSLSRVYERSRAWQMKVEQTFICRLLWIPQSKTVVLRLELILRIKGGFCCGITLLFYGVNSLTR